MNRPLARLGARHLRHHPWQGALALLGVALGVAVVVSIEAANGSALTAFRLSTEALTGRATHQIVGGSAGVPEAVFAELRAAGIRPSAPVVKGRVVLRRGDPPEARVLEILGVDPLSESAFRDYAGSAAGPTFDLAGFLTRPGAVVLEQQAALGLGLAPGDRFEVSTGSTRAWLEVLGTFSIDDPGTRQSIGNLLVTDIATAQETLDVFGRLSRIDLVLPRGGPASGGDAAELEAGPEGGDDSPAARIRRILPPGTRLQPSSARVAEAAEMTRSFRLNLRALSLLALLCGAFLIYNTMTFAVVQRRHGLGTLRALGATRGEILAAVLFEAAAVGVAGTILGTLAGKVLAARLLAQVTQTINDHYFVVSVQDARLSAGTLAAAAFLGIGASLLGALSPAWEAVAATPRASLQRAEVEDRVRRSLPGVTTAGLALVVAGGLLLLAADSLTLIFSGFFLLLLGLACFTPAATLALARLLTPVAGVAAGALGRVAARSVAASMSRTAVAVAALTVAVAVSIGVGLMIRSFRSTVESWLALSLPADLYVSPRDAPTDRFSVQPAGLEPELIDKLRRLEGVERVNTVRGIETEMGVATGGRIKTVPTRLLAYDLDRRGRESIALKDGDPETAWEAVDSGSAVFASEPLAYRHRLEVGSGVDLQTPTGTLRLPVAAIHYDYASERGAILLSHELYKKHWGDLRVTAASIYLESGADAATVAEAARAVGTSAGGVGSGELEVRSNRVLRELSLEVFDRTFVVTRVLRLLAILVAAVGILSALTALQLERAREIGVLRANGLTPGQIWGLVAAETGLMGLIAGILALPLGWLIAVVMVRIINRRSFGWTMALEADAATLAGAVALALGTALVAGLYPAYRMARTPPAEALRGR